MNTTNDGGPAVLSINRTTCSHEPDYIAIQIQVEGRVIKLAITPEQFALALTGISERPCRFFESHPRRRNVEQSKPYKP